MNVLEASCLYAGIVVDTKSFAVQTSVRTFDAASYLRRCGADTALVNKLFAVDMDFIKIFVGMSHDKNEIGFINQFSQCLCDDTDTDTGIADRSRCFSAESFHVFSYTDNRLVTAAAQGKVERNERSRSILPLCRHSC